jgi:folate-binding protein YgfZ
VSRPNSSNSSNASTTSDPDVQPDVQPEVVAVRRSAGLFRHVERGVIAVQGGDRARWLQGMVSNDVASLSPGPTSSGCYAVLLTPKGKIVADMQVLLRPEAFWLDLAGAAAASVIERLGRYIIADDVTLSDESQALARLGVEGPNAEAVLRAAGVDALPGSDAVLDGYVGGAEVAIARFGWTGETGFQLFVPRQSEEAVAAALMEAGAGVGLVEASEEALEILRIEAGVPRFGRELSEDVLPDEARLSRAISYSKGCYTGQEIIARLHSRGQVNHLLVGLRLGGDAVPDVGEEIWPDSDDSGDSDDSTDSTDSRPGRAIGELTSICLSPEMGQIGLAFVRRAQAEPGTRLRIAGIAASVASLPFSTSPRRSNDAAASAPPSGE